MRDLDLLAAVFPGVPALFALYFGVYARRTASGCGWCLCSWALTGILVGLAVAARSDAVYLAALGLSLLLPGFAVAQLSEAQRRDEQSAAAQQRRREVKRQRRAGRDSDSGESSGVRRVRPRPPRG